MRRTASPGSLTADESPEIDRIGAAICSPQVDRSEQEQARIVAETQVTLKRVRRERSHIMEQMSLAPPT